MCSMGGAEEGEIDSLRIFDLFPCVSDSVLNALGPLPLMRLTNQQLR